MIHKTYFALLLLFLLAACAHVEPESRPLIAEAEFGTLSQTPSEARLVIVAQWHLAPQTETNPDAPSQLPQSENQLAIYRQLSKWVKERGLQTLIVEGCEGAMNGSFKDKFNGWSLADLETLTPERLETTMTHVGLKLKASFRDKINIICGDNLKLIKQHQLILSDLRGYLGFKLRLAQARGDSTRYADEIRTLNAVLKLPTKTKADFTEETLGKRLKSSVDNFEKILEERNKSFLHAYQRAMGRSAIVIGALHVNDLSERLHNEGEASVSFIPVGLKGDESLLVDEVRRLLDKNL